MGAGLVKCMLARAVDVGLGPNAFRVLTRMSVIAHDRAHPADPESLDNKGRPATLYFERRSALALALGYLPDRAESDAARQAVKRAVRELKVKGLIKVDAPPSGGAPTRFNLSPLYDAPWRALELPAEMGVDQ